MNLPTILEILEDRRQRQPDLPAILGENQIAVSGEELFETARYIGRVLGAAGIRNSDRVAIVLPNGPEMAMAFLGVASHAVAAPLNPAFLRKEFRFYLSDLEVRTIVCSEAAGEELTGAAAELGIPLLKIAASRGRHGVPLDFPGAEIAARHALEPGGPDDVALVLHTSGTTSRPKQVPLTHRNLCVSARNVAHTLELSGADRFLNVMPLFHIHGLVGALLASLAGGAGVLCTTGFDEDAFWTWLAGYRPTCYSAVPTIHQRIIAHAHSRGVSAAKTSLRFIRSSSTALPPSVMRELENLFRVPVIESYGMTEAAHQMCSNPLPPQKRKPGTVGPPAGPDVAVMDSAGKLLPPGETGELVIRGANVTRGYVNNPEANRTSFVDGWFRTGDLGVSDEDGYFHITGRLKEIINRGGEKIAPREIDEALLEHPSVGQAVAFAVPHKTLGEDLVSAVVLTKDAHATAEQLREFAFEKLAEFKVPSQIVVLEEIPKGPTGKIQRSRLHEQLSDKLRPDHDPLRTATERALGDIWMDLLPGSAPGRADNFFFLGGDSLLATRMVSRVRETFFVDLPPSEVFRHPEIHSLAAHIERKSAAMAVPSTDGDLETLAASLSEEELARLIEEVVNEEASPSTES